MRGLRAAVMFLTRLAAGRVEANDFTHAPGWFAAVGLLVGTAQALFYMLGAGLWGPALGALAAVAAGLMLTGGLHEDGLADTFDGLGGGASAERALEIMRDSRIGSFGALALGLVLGATTLALAQLGPAAAPAALVAAAALSRAAMAVMLRHGPYRRAQGAGGGMTGPQGTVGGLATMASVLVAVALAAAMLGAAVLTGLVGLIVGSGLVWLWARRRLGGVTGDILGAAQQMGALGFLLGALAWL